MSTDYVKVYGLPRTGTNYLQGLFRLNFPQVEFLVNDLGWKHGPKVNWVRWVRHDPPLHVTIVVKDPFAWISSYCRYYFGENSPASRNEVYIKDLAEHYCAMYRHWYEEFIEDMDPTEGCIISYEDLLMDFQNELFRLADNFKLERPSKWTDLKMETSPSDDTEFRGTGRDFARKNYYLERSYMKEFPERLKQQIIEVMDDDLLQLLGYDYKKVRHAVH